jgi:alanyl-tRNA synthetase
MEPTPSVVILEAVAQGRVRATTAELASLFLSALSESEDRIMAKVDTVLNKLESSVDAAVGRVQGEVQKLREEIDALKAQQAEGTLTDEQAARMEALIAKVDALDPTTEATLPDQP